MLPKIHCEKITLNVITLNFSPFQQYIQDSSRLNK